MEGWTSVEPAGRGEGPDLTDTLTKAAGGPAFLSPILFCFCVISSPHYSLGSTFCSTVTGHFYSFASFLAVHFLC